MKGHRKLHTRYLVPWLKITNKYSFVFIKHLRNKILVFLLKLVHKIVEPATLNKFTSFFLQNLFGEYCLVKMCVEQMTIEVTMILVPTGSEEYWG